MECAAVVCTRDRLLRAKAVIVRWWREQKLRREKVTRKCTTAPTTRRQIKKAETGYKPRTVLEQGNTICFER
jgi:hypothetical protein